jgi:hypothetical protein
MAFKSVSAATLLPIKFVFIILQILLLVVIILERDGFIWWPIGVSYTDSSTQYSQASKVLVGVAASWIGICAFEFLMLICGTGIPPY